MTKPRLSTFEQIGFSPDGDRVSAVIGSISQRYSVAFTAWDIATGKEVSAFPINQDVEKKSGRPPRQSFSSVFNPDGSRLAVCPLVDTAPGEVRLYDTATGQVVQTLRDAVSMYLFQFSPDGKMLAATGGDWTVRVWDLGADSAANAAPSLVFRGHTSNVVRLGFDPDNSRLFSSDKHGVVKVWDLVKRDRPMVFEGATRNPTNFVFSATSGRIVDVRRISLRSKEKPLFGKEKRPEPGEKLEPKPEPGEKFNPNLPVKSKITVWDITGKPLAAYDGPHLTSGLSSPQHQVALSPDGARLAIVSYLGGYNEKKGAELHVIEAETGKAIFTHKVDRISPFGDSLTFSRDGKQLAWGFAVPSDGPDAGPPVKGPPFPIKGPPFPMDRVQTQLTLLDSSDGTEIRRFALGEGYLGDLAFSPDGKRLITATEGPDTARQGRPILKITIWDVKTGGRLVEPDCSRHHGCHGLVFSNDGTRVAGVWRVSEPEEKFDVVIWDAASGRTLLTLSGHSANLGKVAFSPDGRRIATTTRPTGIRSGNEVKLWDAATGNELMTLKDLNHNVARYLAFSPDGNRLYAAGFVGSGPNEKIELRTWDATPWELR